jgi:hypothetical protein
MLNLLIWSLDQNYSYADENWVEVEQSPFVIEDNGKEKKIKFLDYIDRRQVWNFRTTFFGAQSELTDYTFSSTQILPSLKSNGALFEGILSLSYNVGVFSTGFDFGVLTGSFKNDVTILQPKASIHIMADAIFKNPYFVPYFKIGGSQMQFDNPSSSDITRLKSNLATFFSLGGMVSLDWFQKELAMDAYFGYGLDATYLVFEYETFGGIPLEIGGLPDVKQKTLKVGLQLVF